MTREEKPMSGQRLFTIGAGTLLALAYASRAFPARAAGEEHGLDAPRMEQLPALAESLASRLEGSRVKLPDATEVPLVASASETSAPPLLTLAQLQTCLGTISEAESWPSAWLVVQHASKPFDLVMHVRMGADGKLELPDVYFTALRREWDAGVLEAAVRQATGKKPPRERQVNVVLQGFSSKIATIYQYDLPKTGKEAKGLMALLPEGSLLREGHRVDLGDGAIHTLALVLQSPVFVPSDCTSCADAIFGHADSGKVLLVLAGEAALEDTLDLTPALKGAGGKPLLPRYRCEKRDEDDAFRQGSYEERFGGREAVRLMGLEDLNRDGVALEVSLPAEYLACGRSRPLIVGIVPGEKKLRIY